MAEKLNNLTINRGLFMLKLTGQQTKVHGYDQNSEPVKPLPPVKTQKELESRVQQARVLQAESQELKATITTLKKIEQNNAVISAADERIKKLEAAQLRIQEAKQAKLAQQSKNT